VRGGQCRGKTCHGAQPDAVVAQLRFDRTGKIARPLRHVGMARMAIGEISSA